MAAPDGGRHGALAVGRPGRGCKPRGQKEQQRRRKRSWEPGPKEHRTKSQQVKSSCTCALQVFKAFKIPEYRPIGRSRPKPQVRYTAELPCGKSVNRGASRSRRRGGTSTFNVTKNRSLGIITSLHITSSTFPSADK